jgi:hypothetical protein
VAELREVHWNISWEAPGHRDQRGGDFRAYVPDDLVTRPVVLDRKLGAKAAKTEAAVRGLADAPGS